MLTGNDSELPSAIALCQLHWLPVKQRIHFKIATLAYCTPQSGSPSYILSLINVMISCRSLILAKCESNERTIPSVICVCRRLHGQTSYTVLYIVVTINSLVGVQRCAIVKCVDFLLVISLLTIEQCHPCL